MSRSYRRKRSESEEETKFSMNPVDSFGHVNATNLRSLTHAHQLQAGSLSNTQFDTYLFHQPQVQSFLHPDAPNFPGGLNSFIDGVSPSLPDSNSSYLEESTATSPGRRKGKRKIRQEPTNCPSEVDLDMPTPPGTKVPPWSHMEEVFLVGSVLERFWKTGSLSSRIANGSNKECWRCIKENYDEAWKNLKNQHSQFNPPDRTIGALNRHYKVMKRRLQESNPESRNSLKNYYREWEFKYNIDDRLLPN